MKRAVVTGGLFFFRLYESSAWLRSDEALGALTPLELNTAKVLAQGYAQWDEGKKVLT
jgi:hypothetical protein